MASGFSWVDASVLETLKDPDRLDQLDSAEVDRVARSALDSELRRQLHLWVIEDPVFDPGRVASILTVLRMDEIANDVAGQLDAVQASLSNLELGTLL
ncbi:MAG: hypothetical protein F4Y04_02430 [Chloroflexi bacterium]|nr:hypothetical protein [Chloroflexota bacterium]